MQAEKEMATVPIAPEPVAEIRNHQQAYTDSLPKSSGNLKEQVGLLLWRLQGPLNQRQRKTGYMLFEALLGQYMPARGGVQ